MFGFVHVVAAFCVVLLSTNANAAAVESEALTACDCRVRVGNQIVGNNFNLAAVQAAYNRGRTYQAGSQQVGRNRYPHRFNNGERLNFPQPCTTPLMEFPIVTYGVFTGSPDTPGPERIVWGANGAFCGCMTHNGVAGNSFQVCH